MLFPHELCQILEKLEVAGFSAFVVGGAVRDLLLGKIPQDWDVATSARPEDILALFAEEALPTGLKHGTVTVVVNSFSAEITTFRCDGAYTDHRHPVQVTFSSDLTEDLARRDFTVNAMAMDQHGTLWDPYGGKADLDSGILRCVGNPHHRFAEDALRIMRCLRFSSQLGFSIESFTREALLSHCGELNKISVERLSQEMTKLLCGENVQDVLLAFPRVFGVFIPEILPCVHFPQPNPHHIFDVWEHITRTVAAVPPQPVLRWSALIHDLGKPSCFSLDEEGTGHFRGHGDVSASMAENICRRLRFSSEMCRKIVLLVAWHDQDIPRTKTGILCALHSLGTEAFFALCQLKRGDHLAQNPSFFSSLSEIEKGEQLAQQLLEENACFSLSGLAVNGNDLLALGYTGAEIGQKLEELLHHVICGTLPNEKSLLLQSLNNMDPSAG